MRLVLTHITKKGEEKNGNGLSKKDTTFSFRSPHLVFFYFLFSFPPLFFLLPSLECCCCCCCGRFCSLLGLCDRLLSRGSEEGRETWQLHSEWGGCLLRRLNIKMCVFLEKKNHSFSGVPNLKFRPFWVPKREFSTPFLGTEYCAVLEENKVDLKRKLPFLKRAATKLTSFFHHCFSQKMVHSKYCGPLPILFYILAEQQ